MHSKTKSPSLSIFISWPEIFRKRSFLKMNDFIYYLDKIEYLIKDKRYNEAWKLVNEALIELAKNKDDSWFMMYYQMAVILTREKKWQNALEKMGYVIHYLRGVGGITHKKFILRLLKKFKKEDKFDEYIKLAIKEKPKDFGSALLKLLK